MIKIFLNIFIILSVLVFEGMKANAENWASSHNKIGNIIYVDTDSIRQKDNKIFYTVKYFEDKLGKDNKVLIMSENKVPFVTDDSIAFKNYSFIKNIQNVNERVLRYVDDHTIPEVEPGSHYESLALNREPYADKIIAKIKSNLKYKFKYRNSSSRALIKINKAGEVKKVFICESSGNKNLDLALTKAIESADPFDPLPENYDKTYAIIWIDVSYEKDKSIIFVNSIVAVGKAFLR